MTQILIEDFAHCFELLKHKVCSVKQFGLLKHAKLGRLAGLTVVLGLTGLLSACGGGGSEDLSQKFSLGGTLSGMADGQTLDLSNGSEIITRTGNGAFTFTKQIDKGGSYEVKVSGAHPAWQFCEVSNSSGSGVVNNVINVIVTCSNADTKATGKYNDTGVDWCTEDISIINHMVNFKLCSAIAWTANHLWGKQQDGYFGRDAEAAAGKLQKVGSGLAGFDYTRIGSSGKVLAKQDGVWSDTGSEAAGTQWDCVRDNVTGLVWEVKRNDQLHLRHKDHIYAWYNTDADSNNGHVGYENPFKDGAAWGEIDVENLIPYEWPTCKGVADQNKCNTQSFVTAVNAAGLCGKKDWRMPTNEELMTLVNLGQDPDLTIDIHHFPNSAPMYWSSGSSVWYWGITGSYVLYKIDRNDQLHLSAEKWRGKGVRLVRSGE